MQRTNEKGATLIEILVVVTIMGVFAFMFSDYLTSNKKTESKLDTAGELEDLRKFVRIGIDFTKTKASAPANCGTGSQISLKRRDNTDLIKNASGSSRTKIGVYFLQARCFDTTKPGEIQVFYTKVDTQSATAPLFAVPLVISR